MALKAEVDKLNINKPTNVQMLISMLVNWKVPVDLKELSHEVDNEVVKNTKLNKLKTKETN